MSPFYPAGISQLLIHCKRIGSGIAASNLIFDMLPCKIKVTSCGVIALQGEVFLEIKNSITAMLKQGALMSNAFHEPLVAERISSRKNSVWKSKV